MRKNNSNEPNFDELLNLLRALDSGLLKALQAQGIPIIVVTAVPAARIRDDEDDGYDVDDDCDDEPEDDEDCPEYEPSEDGTGRCVYACPECGTCLRDYIGEEFE